MGDDVIGRAASRITVGYSPSSSGNDDYDLVYWVGRELEHLECSCPGFHYRGTCKHMAALLEGEQGSYGPGYRTYVKNGVVVFVDSEHLAKVCRFRDKRSPDIRREEPKGEGVDVEIKLEYRGSNPKTQQGYSEKFWLGKVKGDTFTRTWGKIGSNGQSQVEEFGSNTAARAAMDKVVADKKAKGYVQVYRIEQPTVAA